MLEQKYTNGMLMGLYGWHFVTHLVHVMLVSAVCCQQHAQLGFLARKLQDPAGFLHWFHTVLRIQRPDVICAPRPLSAGPQALANVQEDLLQALRLDAENPHAFAIFVDEAGYMVSMHRMVDVTYLLGSFEMPRDDFNSAVTVHVCPYRHTLCTLASYFTSTARACRQLPM